jgi:hypothetical protein
MGPKIQSPAVRSPTESNYRRDTISDPGTRKETAVGTGGNCVAVIFLLTDSH